ncbi:uncharacterized protein SEPMUDRAFT_109376 [Sphaerulina musiva SO2202]|uniref:Uncharacterized protein n=1 Tax=Sphaerulina musiva (strain SO2202) TaxID=692275 RepID=M3BVC6_SPHMS|nr:uncharacterized protein SEPMUDRAFT_109376 [Sphaerulina musiva SO2202]EMF11284.1 hypothetical protein SEPMUDRAFT_109376 [Sphaerulina musiva SO2202]
MFASSLLAILLALTSTAHAACSDHEVRLDCKSGGCPKEEATCPEGIEGVVAQSRMVTRYSCDTTLPVCLVKLGHAQASVALETTTCEALLPPTPTVYTVLHLTQQQKLDRSRPCIMNAFRPLSTRVGASQHYSLPLVLAGQFEDR